VKNTICSNFMLAKPTEIMPERQSNGTPAGFHYIAVGDVLGLMLSNRDIL